MRELSDMVKLWFCSKKHAPSYALKKKSTRTVELEIEKKNGLNKRKER